MARTVVVDEERLCYHDPSQLGSTIEMDEMTEEQARDEGAVQCSECYPEQDGVMYDFAYRNKGSA